MDEFCYGCLICTAGGGRGAEADENADDKNYSCG